MAKTLRTQLFKHIASVMSSDDESFKSASNIILFTRTLRMYPNKSIWYMICDKLIHYNEQNIHSVPLIIETMKDEGEDPEIISNIEMLRSNQPIKTQSEVTKLCSVLNDYVVYAKLLKDKDSLIKTIDMMDDSDESIHNTVESMVNISNQVLNSYNSINMNATPNSFDTDDPEGMKTGIARTKDRRSADKIIVTGERGLNSLLSPGLVSGSLYVYQGLPGNYKSGMLLDGHVSACKYNSHIVQALGDKRPISMYITMENSLEQTISRLWAILYPTADMSMFTVDEVCDMIKKELESTGWRSVILYYGYRTKSTADIANVIRMFNTDTTQVAVLFFDYIKRVRPARTDASATASEKTELNSILNEFKAMAIEFNIPVATGHQLNRVAQAQIDGLQNGGFGGKSVEALKRSNTGSAFEVVEVADCIIGVNIESDGESKYIIWKAMKQRDKDDKENISYDAVRHPFISVNSFALRHDINEACSIATPIFGQRSVNNFNAASIANI